MKELIWESQMETVHPNQYHRDEIEDPFHDESHPC